MFRPGQTDALTPPAGQVLRGRPSSFPPQKVPPPIRASSIDRGRFAEPTSAQRPFTQQEFIDILGDADPLLFGALFHRITQRIVILTRPKNVTVCGTSISGGRWVARFSTCAVIRTLPRGLYCACPTQPSPMSRISSATDILRRSSNVVSASVRGCESTSLNLLPTARNLGLVISRWPRNVRSEER